MGPDSRMSLRAQRRNLRIDKALLDRDLWPTTDCRLPITFPGVPPLCVLGASVVNPNESHHRDTEGHRDVNP
jgi:hypothetical protein